jgi:hypothetical protein
MSEENKPKPTLDDVNGPIMRLDASRQPEKDTVALNEGIRNREAIANSKPPAPKPLEKPAE